MTQVVFYELPAGSVWSGIAKLASVLVGRGFLNIVVDSEADAARVSAELWNLPPSSVIPNGVEGLDAEPDVDPAVISVGIPSAERPLTIHASLRACEMLVGSGLIAEVVPCDSQAKRCSRQRFKSYKDHGHMPTYEPWEVWSDTSRGVGDSGT